MNNLQVSSIMDGFYQFNITRLPPDVTNITWSATQTTSTDRVDITPYLFPTYTPGITLDYNMDLPFLFQNVTLTLKDIKDDIRKQ